MKKTIFEMNELQAFLEKATPPDPVDGRQLIQHLADLVGVTKQNMYHHIRRGKLPPELAVRIVHACGGRITLADCHRFVYGEKHL